MGVLHFHGLADECAPFFGGPSTGLDPSIRPSVRDSIAHFVTENDCDRLPNFTWIGQATCLSFDDCAEGVEVEVCAIAGHGHVW